MMDKINNFYDLEAWKEGHNLVLKIYKISNEFPKDEKFGLVSQIKRAVTSITANIAEGFERYHFNDKKRFYYQSRGSLGEVQNFLILAKDMNFIDLKVYNGLNEEITKTRKLINGLIRSIENQK